MDFWLVTGTVKALQRHMEYYCGMLLYTDTFLPAKQKPAAQKNVQVFWDSF
jgi:hypothetical protein